ncbi:hypothetical protein C2R22_05640 [Salinigranum rubrum]|uniref:Uncharacterized protein n=1 Tax=Salinigranum rubrum TaxID=755307 RepID=A0A2I8VH02_9EURY|nr:hypothetical protein [Salinigranum rubrum]AUV81205.1 hypothetical protein C2R22_05640 [Salinigranum rubrum]
MNVDRITLITLITLITPNDEPNIDLDLARDEGYVHERETHVSVSVPAAAVGTDDVEDYPITVSGGRPADGALGRSSRTFTYSGEIVEVSTRHCHVAGDRLRFRCEPGSLRSRHPRTAPRGTLS